MITAEEFWTSMSMGSVPAIGEIKARDNEWRAEVKNAEKRGRDTAWDAAERVLLSSPSTSSVLDVLDRIRAARAKGPG
jgi:hypothetical protein